MTSMKDLASATGDDRDDVIRRQAAELERLKVELATWRKRYEKGEKRDIAFTNSEAEVEPLFVKTRTPAGEQVRLAVQDACKRLLCPAMETEMRLDSKKRADEAA